jgi:CelD/BcsL family acetyltransferase involved in cellulose biosynthesis
VHAAIPTTPTPARLVARRLPFAAIPRAAWDRLVVATARPTPFSGWTFHRAWWDAYGAAAHEEYMVCVAPGAAGAVDDARAATLAGGPALGPAVGPAAGRVIDPVVDPDGIVAIAPLMHRHEVEPDDALTRTTIRHEAGLPVTSVAATAKAVFFGASYHADYATLLCAPADLPAAAAAVVEALAAGPDLAHGTQDWDVVDLRRLHEDDPALGVLEAAFRAAAPLHGWSVLRETEDVCPVLRLETDDWETYLATLDSKDRHEIRRKMRRAEGAGEVRFETIPHPSTFVDEFIAIHQARWGDQGLFPATEGGARSRRFLARLAELEGPDGRLAFGRLTVGGEAVFASAAFHEGDTAYFYNAGSSPAARNLSPGVVGMAWYLRERLAAGCRRFDFLRGNESYKYEWGAVDETIQRLLVTRMDEA